MDVVSVDMQPCMDALVMPLHSAQVHRGFSAQNIIVTSSRNRISADIVDKLMMVKWWGKNIQDFYFDAPVNKWKSSKNRIFSVLKD